MANRSADFFALAGVVAAGAFLPLQALLLSAMVDRGAGRLGALMLNSAVGLVLLTAACMVGDAWPRGLRPWFVVPGLLGTAVMFALLASYPRHGAALTTVVLIAAQVVAALLLDRLAPMAATASSSPLLYAGATLCVVGAAITLLASARAGA